MKRFVRFIPFAVLIVFLVAAFMYREGLQARVTMGEPAPSFVLESLNGEDVSFDSFLGQPIMINFWTTWCPECLDESIALQSFHEQYGDEITVVGINMREPATVIQRFTDRFGLTYPILLDKLERVKRVYRVTGVPETIFIDANGVAVHRHIGAITEEQLILAAEQLLGRH